MFKQQVPHHKLISVICALALLKTIFTIVKTVRKRRAIGGEINE